MPPIELILEENQALKGKVSSLTEEVANLKAELAIFRKQIFGSGKNEKQDKAQLLLTLGQLEARIAEVETERVSYERRKPGAARQPPAEIFDKLPVRETIEIIPPEVKADPDLYERIGEETTFEVDIVHPQLYKRMIVRPKYRHLLDRSRPPLVAPAMKRPIMGGYASAGTDLLRRPLQIRPPPSALPTRADVGTLGRETLPKDHGGLGRSHGLLVQAHLPADEGGVDQRVRTFRPMKPRSDVRIRTNQVGKPSRAGSGQSVGPRTTSSLIGVCPGATRRPGPSWPDLPVCCRPTATRRTPVLRRITRASFELDVLRTPGAASTKPWRRPRWPPASCCV